MAAGDVLLIYALLPETLPSNRRVSSVVVCVYCFFIIIEAQAFIFYPAILSLCAPAEGWCGLHNRLTVWNFCLRNCASKA